jgi:hypothetical protein
VISAYGGTFLADPKTGDLIRLSIITSELPPETGTCEVAQTLDYERMRLNGADFLLPAQTLVEFVNRDGSEADNRSVYSNCHEFRGESTLSFEPFPDSAPGESVGAPGRPVNTLPPGLPFKLALTQRIDTATAAAGDPISAELTTDLRDKASRLLVPAGTVVTGRIVKALYRYATRPPTLVLSIKLESLSVGGVSRPIWAVAAPQVARSAFDRKGNLVRQVAPGFPDLPDDDGVAALTFRDVKPGYVVPPGIETNWRTSGP